MKTVVMYKLQKILTNGFVEIDGTRHMYYRSPVTIYNGEKGGPDTVDWVQGKEECDG